jgi:hypothetical protein
MCGGPLDWSSHVGEIDIRNWYLGKAVAEKFFTCSECWAKVKDKIQEVRFWSNA